MEYLVVFEKADDGSYSAFVPDLPGCVSCGESIAESQSMIQEAISVHLDSLRRHEEPIPKPSAVARMVQIL